MDRPIRLVHRTYTRASLTLRHDWWHKRRSVSRQSNIICSQTLSHVEEVVVTSNSKIMVIRKIVVVQTITMQVAADPMVIPTILSRTISVIFVENWDILLLLEEISQEF
jgi:hypothetical protein